MVCWQLHLSPTLGLILFSVIQFFIRCLLRCSGRVDITSFFFLNESLSYLWPLFWTDCFLEIYYTVLSLGFPSFCPVIDHHFLGTFLRSPKTPFWLFIYYVWPLWGSFFLFLYLSPLFQNITFFSLILKSLWVFKIAFVSRAQDYFYSDGYLCGFLFFHLCCWVLGMPFHSGNSSGPFSWMRLLIISLHFLFHRLLLFR